MSYPFGKAVNWDEFIQQMNGIGVVFKEEIIPGLNDHTIAVSYFEHKMDGKSFTCVVDISDRKEMLLPSTIRVICKSLGLHPSLFGLDLG